MSTPTEVALASDGPDGTRRASDTNPRHTEPKCAYVHTPHGKVKREGSSVGIRISESTSSPMPAQTPALGHGHVLFSCAVRVEPRLHITNSLSNLLVPLPRYCYVSASWFPPRLGLYEDVFLYMLLLVVLANTSFFSARSSPFPQFSTSSNIILPARADQAFPHHSFRFSANTPLCTCTHLRVVSIISQLSVGKGRFL